MTKKKVRVADYMTKGPHTIDAAQPLARAHALMREHSIRHLPVLQAGALAGMVSLRDLHLIETLKDVDPATATVEEAMTRDPLVTRPEAWLGDVAREMAEKKLGSAVVLDGGRVVGVLTTVDCLRALSDLLSSDHANPASGR